MSEGNLDALVEGIARHLFSPPHGIQLRQRRLPAQAQLSPQRERLRYRNRVAAVDIGVAIIPIHVRQYWIVKLIRAGSLGRGSRGFERRRTQRRVEPPACREHAFHRRAQGHGP